MVLEFLKSIFKILKQYYPILLFAWLGRIHYRMEELRLLNQNRFNAPTTTSTVTGNTIRDSTVSNNTESTTINNQSFISPAATGIASGAYVVVELAKERGRQQRFERSPPLIFSPNNLTPSQDGSTQPRASNTDAMPSIQENRHEVLPLPWTIWVH